MSRRSKPQPPKLIQLKDSDKLTKYIDDLLSYTQGKIRSAARHGVSETVNQLMRQTIDNIASSGFKGMTSSNGVPLYMGVRGFMIKNQVIGFVHVLGDTIHNDGTFRLRFFERGTKPHNTPLGYTKGVKGWYFFKRGTANALQLATQNIQASIEKTIDEINNA